MDKMSMYIVKASWRASSDAEVWSRTERLDRVERLLRTAGLIEG